MDKNGEDLPTPTADYALVLTALGGGAALLSFFCFAYKVAKREQ